MKTGHKLTGLENLMALKTRLDSRSENNKSFKVIDTNGKTLVEVALVNNCSATLEVTTAGNMYIEKPNGWTSSKD